MRVDLRLTACLGHQIRRQRYFLTLLIPGRPHSFRECDDTAAMLLVHAVDITQIAINGKLPLRHIDQMWTIIVMFAGQGCRSRQPTRMTPHNDCDVNAR